MLDCLSRPEFSGGLGGVVKVIESAAERLNWDRLDRYLQRLGSRSLALRLGYLVDSVVRTTPPPARWIARAQETDPDEPYIPLGAPKEFGRRGDPRPALASHSQRPRGTPACGGGHSLIPRTVANRFADRMGVDLHIAQQEVVLLYALDALHIAGALRRLAFKGEDVPCG